MSDHVDTEFDYFRPKKTGAARHRVITTSLPLPSLPPSLFSHTPTTHARTHRHRHEHDDDKPKDCPQAIVPASASCGVGKGSSI